jgi:hypothetical protein
VARQVQGYVKSAYVQVSSYLNPNYTYILINPHDTHILI